MADCLFCKVVAREIPARIVYEDEELLVFEDIRPQAPTHVLIIPKAHVATVNDLDPSHDSLVGTITRRAASVARERGFAEQGYRLVWNCNAGAGQTVFHIHLHLLGGRTFSWPPG
jgi:histidine triad (HIT) family protein